MPKTYRPGQMVYRPKFSMKPDRGYPLRYTVAAHKVTPEEAESGIFMESYGAYTGSVEVYSLSSAKNRAMTKNRRIAKAHHKKFAAAHGFFRYKEKELKPVAFPEKITQPRYTIGQTVYFMRVQHYPIMEFFYGKGVIVGVRLIGKDECRHSSDPDTPEKPHWSYQLHYRSRANKIDLEHDDKLRPTDYVDRVMYVREDQISFDKEDMMEILRNYNVEWCNKWVGFNERLQNLRKQDLKDGEALS